MQAVSGISAIPELDDPLLTLERVAEGFYAIDRQWRFLHVNAYAERFWDRRRETLLGLDMRTVFPRFEGSTSFLAHQQALETGRAIEIETYSTVNGAPVSLRFFPDKHGLSVFFGDITRRHELETALRERNDLLTLAEQSAGIGIWVANLANGTVRATPQFFKLLGLDPVAEPVSVELPRSLRHPEDRERVAQGFREALESGADRYETEYRIVRPNGEERWIFGRGRVSRDLDGRPSGYSGVDIDITERKQQSEHLRVVSRELVHRTNNLLAVVQSMARQTAISSRSVREFETRLSARLQGLGDSNALLVRQDWRGARLDDLVRAQLGPFGAGEGRQIEVRGPPVLLSAKVVQNLGLALHELATNATKYGALSNATGRVEVSWALVDDQGGRQIRLGWRESGGPPVKAPRRRGFGTVVIERVAAQAVGGPAVLSFLPSGVNWTIDIPEAELELLTDLTNGLS